MDIGIVLVLIFMAMIIVNIPIAISLGLSTLVTMLIYKISLTMYLSIIFSGLSKYTLLAIPFFILSGFIMEKAGISKRIVNFAKLIIGPIPGGLGIMSVGITLFWGAISGSGPATVAALGTILIPAMIESGYSAGFAAGLVAATGAISVVIPPSITLVVYGVLSGQSIGTLFIAGIMPGIIMGLCCCLYVYLFALKNGYKGEPYGKPSKIWKAFKEASWGLIAPVIILGGIYGGVFTPTEAAVVAVFYSLVVGLFIYREFDMKQLWKIVAESGVSTASILIIMANASAFTWLITTQGVAQRFGTALMSVSDSKLVILMIINLMLIIAGFFIDGISISYIFVPLLLPVVTKLGMDPIWFGVIMTVAIAIGFSTPPVAVNLYPACRIAKINLATISVGVMGFVIASIVALILTTVFPGIIMWLPKVLGM